jgi:SnoaL-like domain
MQTKGEGREQSMSERAYPTPSPEQLCAIEACREASRRYSYGLDRLDGDVMKSACWSEAIVDYGAFVGNAWDFCDRTVSSHGRFTFTMHTTSNHQVELDADGVHARGEAYTVCYLFAEADRRLSTWFGRYLDTYERRGDEWRIMHRVCVHHGDTTELVPDSMGIDTSKFRQGSFDRPAQQRPIGP